MLLAFSQMDANNSENGMVSATIRAARAFSKKRKRMTVTRIIPSVRLCSTVCNVKCSRSLRSSMGTTVTPGGRMPLLS